MADYSDEVAQWSASARGVYVAAVETAIETLAAHAERVQARQGRESELMAYFDSAGTVQVALDRLREAEFDLCGSVPFSAVSFDHDADELEDDDEDEDDAGGGWLTVELVAHYAVADEEKLIQAGRAAYLSAWPEQLSEDAEVRVTSPSTAIGELIHSVGLSALDTDNDLLQQRWHRVSVTEATEETPFPSPEM